MNELTFLDLVILKKIDAESSVEKFGSIINTSFFETANLLGTTKIKGYINIESSVGGISRVSITDAGTGILAIADQKSKEPIEPLDNAILHAVAGGARELEALQHQLNIRSGDLAYHISKLLAQGFMDYEVRSAKVYLVLTEMGFNSTGGVRVQQKIAESPPQELKAETGEAKKQAPSSAPPWVSPADVKKEDKQKADVEHILKDEHAHAHPHDGHHEHRHDRAGGAAQSAPSAQQRKSDEKKPKRELTAEERKKSEQLQRTISKLEYYLVEYAPYALLIILVLGIFTAAIFLSLGKF